jgi:NADH-quinone oxidoreductase subunit E
MSEAGQAPTPAAPVQAALSRHPRERGALIPLLQDIQETLGYVSPESLRAASRHLNLPESSVYGVVTFYSQFHLTPQGKHIVKVCQGTACHVRGSDDIVKAVQAALGIAPGETTEDFEFSLERVACFGSCALAPVLVIDDTVYGNMTPERAVDILESLT